jgi:catechol 2,3-dioxygenase-like lactoylglutathione lyase family enzyme
MKVTGFNHLSIGCKNLEESVKFYETVLGMEPIPSYNFGFRTKYLRCGDLQLHIFELEDSVSFYEQNAEGLRASLYLDRPHLKTARRAS